MFFVSDQEKGRTSNIVGLLSSSEKELGEEIDHLREESPEFENAAQALAASRLQELVDRDDVEADAEQWANQAIAGLSEATVVPTDAELHEASEEHGGAPMAIWLGILLDGIPESFVIGSALVVSITAAIAQSGADSVTFATMVPYTLIAGLFLANFPEAMSSSIAVSYTPLTLPTKA